MAFSKAPSQNTYQTKEVKLLNALRNRNAAVDKDTIAINGFFDVLRDRSTEEKDYFFVKRDGTVKYAYEIPSDTVRGMFYWEDQNKLFIAYNNKIAICTASTGALVTTVTPFTTTSGDVGFTEFYYDTGATKIVVSDGSRLITIDSSNTVVTGSDPDMPTSFGPHTVFLDGYLFLFKEGTSDIYNSNLNDPLAYTAGNYITAEMVADKLLRIVRLNNYIVAFGTNSMEYFYDAANASGSPLARVDIPIKNIGLLGGIAQKGNRIFFVGQTTETGPEIFVIEDWKIDPIDNPPIRRFIQPGSTFYGAIVSIGGYDFYVLTLGSITYCLNIETKTWTRLAFKQTDSMAIKSAVNMLTSNGYVSLFSLSTGTALYSFVPSVYQDDGVNFTVTVQTFKTIFDSFHKKFGSRLLVIGDKANAGTAQVSWTDDDYQTFSTPRDVILSQDRPGIYRMGAFRERAFKLTYTQNQPMRIDHFEYDYNLGSK